MNVELEPGFQTNAQKRDNGKCLVSYTVPRETNIAEAIVVSSHRHLLSTT